MFLEAAFGVEDAASARSAEGATKTLATALDQNNDYQQNGYRRVNPREDVDESFHLCPGV